MAALDWLTARPIAHRGLHDAARGVIENTPSAFQAAIDADFGIECDVQVSADGDAMVHHDAVLGRLTEGEGPLAGMSTTALRDVRFRATTDRIITLGELCSLVGGRVPLVVEIKSTFDGTHTQLTQRVASTLARYDGPAAAMSFDPEVVTMLRERAPELTRGIVAERHYADREWSWMSAAQRFAFGNLLHMPQTCPHFIAYNVKELPTLATTIARRLMRRPLLTWTVRSAEDREAAARHASQMIFEGFRP